MPFGYRIWVICALCIAGLRFFSGMSYSQSGTMQQELTISMESFSANAFPNVKFVVAVHNNSGMILGLSGVHFRLYEDGLQKRFAGTEPTGDSGSIPTKNRNEYSVREVTGGYEFSYTSQAVRGKGSVHSLLIETVFQNQSHLAVFDFVEGNGLISTTKLTVTRFSHAQLILLVTLCLAALGLFVTLMHQIIKKTRTKKTAQKCPLCHQLITPGRTHECRNLKPKPVETIRRSSVIAEHELFESKSTPDDDIIDEYALERHSHTGSDERIDEIKESSIIPEFHESPHQEQTDESEETHQSESESDEVPVPSSNGQEQPLEPQLSLEAVVAEEVHVSEVKSVTDTKASDAAEALKSDTQPETADQQSDKELAQPDKTGQSAVKVGEEQSAGVTEIKKDTVPAPEDERTPIFEQMYFLRGLDGDQKDKEYPIDIKQVTIIGSSALADLVIADETIRTVHARLYVEGDLFYIATLDTISSMQVDGVSCAQAQLTCGVSIVTLGQNRFLFDMKLKRIN